MWLIVNLEELFANINGKKAGAGFLLSLLCIYPFIVFFQYIDFSRHQNQVTIEQTVCAGLTWEDTGSYYHGVDYLNFSVDVSFGSMEVSNFVAHTLVMKDGKYVGHIRTRFAGTSERVEDNVRHTFFEVNTKQTLPFTISHPTNTSWSGDELFQQLYEGDSKEFTFVTNIISVTFTDGTTTGHILSMNSDFYYDENGVIHFKDHKSGNQTYYYYDSNGKKHYDEK